MTKRIGWIDIARACAILLVVLCHATERTYSMTLAYMTGLPVLERAAVFASFTLGRLGVPLFMMISGYLLLDREYDEKACVRFWKNNVLRLLICTEFWFLFYDVYLALTGKEAFSIAHVAMDLLFFRKVNMAHTWYMPMVLGMYILFPYVANALRSMKPSMLAVPVAIYGFYAFIYLYLRMASKLFLEEPFELQFSLGFSGGYYGLYFILGYAVRKGALKKLRGAWLALSGIVSFVFVVCAQLAAYRLGVQHNVWYSDIFLLLCALSIFELMSRMNEGKGNKAARMISRYAFAVYLIHDVILQESVTRIQASGFPASVRVGILWLLAFVLSIVFAAVIVHIPKAGKYLLYIK